MTSVKSEKVRIFLCYAREDIAAVKAVYQKLSDAGYYPWMDKKDILPGQFWRTETPKALKSARFVIIFFSKHSVSKRGYVQREFKLALDTLEEMPEGQVYVIPVRLDECEVPESFGHIHYCDLFEEDGLELVLKTIKSQLEEPAEAEEVGIPLEEHQRVLKELEEQKKQFEKKGKKHKAKKRRREQKQKIPQVTKEKSSGLFSLDNFVEIPAGSFQMGSETGYDDEKPVHAVRISKPFYMGKYPVTQKQWEAVIGDKASEFKGTRRPVEMVFWNDMEEFLPEFKGNNLPVEMVSWNDVQEFLRRLNQEMDRELFRLPTEAEWEYACRAGTKGDFAGNLDDMAWYKNNSDGMIHPVGKKQPNVWGLYDMHGNVWEWCQDWYDDYSNSAVSDPTGPATGSGRVVRGGSSHSSARYCRSAYRRGDSPGRRDLRLGFRLVRTAK